MGQLQTRFCNALRIWPLVLEYVLGLEDRGLLLLGSRSSLVQVGRVVELDTHRGESSQVQAELLNCLLPEQKT